MEPFGWFVAGMAVGWLFKSRPIVAKGEHIPPATSLVAQASAGNEKAKEIIDAVFAAAEKGDTDAIGRRADIEAARIVSEIRGGLSQAGEDEGEAA